MVPVDFQCFLLATLQLRPAVNKWPFLFYLMAHCVLMSGRSYFCSGICMD